MTRWLTLTLCVAMLLGTAIGTAVAFERNRYLKPEVLDAWYTGNISAIPTQTEAQKATVMGYKIGILGILDKQCGMLDAAGQFTLGFLNVVAPALGGPGFVLAASDGETDAKRLVEDYGCRSREMLRIYKGLNSSE